MTNQDAVLPEIGEKFESVSLKPRTRQDFPLPRFLFNRVFNVLAGTPRQEKEIRSMKIGKEVKVFLFANDMLYKLEIEKIPPESS